MNVYTVCCGGTSDKRTKDVKGTQSIKNEKKKSTNTKIPRSAWMSVLSVFYQAQVSAKGRSPVQRRTTDCEYACVWFWNLSNVAVLVRFGLQRQGIRKLGLHQISALRLSRKCRSVECWQTNTFSVQYARSRRKKNARRYKGFNVLILVNPTHL
jgi:hypothetical protein